MLVFDLLDFAQPHLHILPHRFAQIGFGGSGAALFGQPERLFAKCGQLVFLMIKHEYSQRVIALILTAFLRRRQKCGYRRYNLCPIDRGA